jgi:hypothetical protein
MIMLDDPRPVARAYNGLNFGRLEAEDGRLVRAKVDAPAEIADAWFETADGERVTTHAQDDLMRICMRVRFHAAMENPVFGVNLRNDALQTVFATSTWDHGAHTGYYEPGDEVVFRVSVYDWLGVGRYRLTPTVARAGGADVLDVRDDLASLLVHGMRRSGSVVEIPHELDLERP